MSSSLYDVSDLLLGWQVDHNIVFVCLFVIFTWLKLWLMSMWFLEGRRWALMLAPYKSIFDLNLTCCAFMYPPTMSHNILITLKAWCLSSAGLWFSPILYLYKDAEVGITRPEWRAKMRFIDEVKEGRSEVRCERRGGRGRGLIGGRWFVVATPVGNSQKEKKKEDVNFVSMCGSRVTVALHTSVWPSDSVWQPSLLPLSFL